MDTPSIDHPKFPKIKRLFRDVTITEKIDGTNAIVHVSEEGEVFAGSRNRWITPEKDNFGFAQWVLDHAEELKELGPGTHYGEWWGQGIQRGYGLDHKRFSLFNTGRWLGEDAPPECCYVVPVLYEGLFNENEIMDICWELRQGGSKASPGYMNPEGICVWHHHLRTYMKVTIDGDGHKGASN